MTEAIDPAYRLEIAMPAPPSNEQLIVLQGLATAFNWVLINRPAGREATRSDSLLTPENQAVLDSSLLDLTEQTSPRGRRGLLVLHQAGIESLRDMLVIGIENCGETRNVSQETVDGIVSDLVGQYPDLPVTKKLHIPTIARYCTSLEQVTWRALDPYYPEATFVGSGSRPSVYDVLTKPWIELALDADSPLLDGTYPERLRQSAMDFANQFAEAQIQLGLAA